MEINIKHQPSFSIAIVNLDSNETIKAESGAMVSMGDGINIETKSQGGFMGGLRRMVGGESFFQNTFTAPAQGGEVTLAPTLPGDMFVMEMSGQEFMLQSGGYIASEDGVSVDSSWGGARGFFGGAGLILLKVTGQGKVLCAAYGAIEERNLAPGERYTIDTGHVVAFEGGMEFNVRKVGGWKSTFLSGEGLVCELVGPGRVLLQTRSEEAFLGWLVPRLPQSSSS